MARICVTREITISSLTFEIFFICVGRCVGERCLSRLLLILSGVISLC